MFQGSGEWGMGGLGIWMIRCDRRGGGLLPVILSDLL